MQREFDILCAGDLLVELITAEFAQTPDEAVLFKRVPGGGAATLCMNMARLGNSALLVAAVGNDDMGTVLKNYVSRLGVDVSFVSTVDEPTTLLLATRSAAGSNVQPYRGADVQLALRQFPYGRFDNLSLFHTTCFALSKTPAQRVILEAAETAYRAKCQLSIDVNYVEKLWPERREAQRVVSEYCRLGALVKITDTEWIRLYDEAKPTPEAVLDHFLKLGAAEVCLNLSTDGCWVADSQERHFLPSRPVDAKDTNGAGEAFWAGYLTARLDGRTLQERALAGRRHAELKVGQIGPLPDRIDRQVIYADFAV